MGYCEVQESTGKYRKTLPCVLSNPVRVAIYTRVSTGSQTTENQMRELQAVAERHGWQVVATFTDEGISGAKGRDQRPGLNSLLEGVTRRDFDKVMAWSVNRLGRSLSDLLSVMGELKAKGVGINKIARKCGSEGCRPQTRHGWDVDALCHAAAWARRWRVGFCQSGRN